jgi:hypothetical protein
MAQSPHARSEAHSGKNSRDHPPRFRGAAAAAVVLTSSYRSTRARRVCAAAADATRLVEGDEPRRDELDVHLRGIDASLLELRSQPVCIGQRRRTLHVDEDHAIAGGDVARGPADRVTELTRSRQRVGFA